MPKKQVIELSNRLYFCISIARYQFISFINRVSPFLSKLIPINRNFVRERERERRIYV